MKKRILCILLSAFTILAMCGCSLFDKDQDQVIKQTKTENTEDVIESNKKKEKDKEKDIDSSAADTSNDKEDDNEADDAEFKIVVDGNEIITDNEEGSDAKPIIRNGVKYIPADIVEEAFGKSAYWDGKNYTLYFGSMGGALEYPTEELRNMTSISDEASETDRLKDNYGNTYAHAICNDRTKMEYLVNMKYSKFKGTLYIPEGESRDGTVYFSVIADGKTLYSSPELTKASAPIDVDVDITGYNNIKLEFNDDSYPLTVCLANSGFYQ